MSVQATAPAVLLPELLGFSPQFVLDQIINIANNAVQQSVDAIEGFLRRWADKRVEKLGGDWDSTQEIEQGLVAFQTLLESHVDIALDFFERGLNLEQSPEKEQELLAEIEDLRRQIAVQRKLNRMYKIAARIAAARETRSQKRLERLSLLRSPQMQTLQELPEAYLKMYRTGSSLAPLDPKLSVASQTSEPGKRQWETGRGGYTHWAVGELLTKAGDGKNWGVRSVVESAYGVGRAGDVKALLDAELGAEREESMDITS